MSRLSLFLVVGVVVALTGCAYPRHSTLVHAAPPSAEPQEIPGHLWSIRFVDAQLPESKLGGLSWDGDSSGPDPFVRLTLDGRVVWESPVQTDTLHPTWNFTLPHNIYVSPQTRFKLELWDSDTAGIDPAGKIVRSGLPDIALPDASAHLTLDNGAVLTVVVSKPLVSQGLGVDFEQHSDALWVLAVERFSPAARAGIQVGDRVVAIGETRVAQLTGAKAASELSLSADRAARLIVADQHGKEREVQLERGYLWLTM